jgi:large subunit ribosomal protein L2
MAIRKTNPTSAGRRGYSFSDQSDLSHVEPLKKLLSGKSNSGGRNNVGRTTTRFRGGGHKRRYRIIDFRRNKIGVPATVATIEYDPNRTARIALLNYADGEKSYILAPDGLKVGDQVLSSRFADIRPGNSLALQHIPSGTFIHNIELKKGKGGQLVRSAGVAARLTAKEGVYCSVKLPSGEIRLVHQE